MPSFNRRQSRKPLHRCRKWSEASGIFSGRCWHHSNRVLDRLENGNRSSVGSESTRRPAWRRRTTGPQSHEWDHDRPCASFLPPPALAPQPTAASNRVPYWLELHQFGRCSGPWRSCDCSRPPVRARATERATMAATLRTCFSAWMERPSRCAARKTL